MPKDGKPRRRCSPKRRAGRGREPGALPDLHGLSPEALLAHRELQYIRNPSPERLRKLREARAMASAAAAE